jgi:cysteine desulfurase
VPQLTHYLDYAATTPTDPRVVQAMLPYFDDEFGNPSSVHGWGQRAESAVEQSRSVLAADLGCLPEEIVFTSGGSESDNLALRGTAWKHRRLRGAKHILTTPVEHHAVLHTARQLDAFHGFELELLPVDRFGRVDPQALEERIRADTAIVSVIFGNNEIGTLNPIGGLGEVCRERKIPFHSDALQITSQHRLNVDELRLDLASIGAHKFYGPKGVGALYVREAVDLAPTQTGGAQEAGRRAGTSNVPLIVGMAEAIRIASERRSDDAHRFRGLRDRIIDGVLETIPHASLTGHPKQRLPNHASFVFEGIESNQLLAALDLAGYACSAGSACKTGDPEPSEVLLAIGNDSRLSLGSLRVSVGRHTLDSEVDSFLTALPQIVERLRELEPSIS